jgi:hypothetical protein
MIDHSLCPDRDDLNDLPKSFDTDESKADYIDRLCAAWDFGITPERDVVFAMRDWREVFDKFPLRHSPSYHTLRTILGWPPVPRSGGQFIPLRYEILDGLEGRTDPCWYSVVRKCCSAWTYVISLPGRTSTKSSRDSSRALRSTLNLMEFRTDEIPDNRA